ncbi:RNA polymerase sigma factor [Paremcibacter congregatus]|uniref:RNA polymerase subunit sigma-24 n=1 Tax=Paremcibacter congregatus TaxID=2043170 RepID=A0A2G4YRZ0_9PROT|nr:sigma-70 family RNA polymerase sigma factor [Paremcibacter congregatus]PHZ85109.1 hypothetical protein CRD36_08490 [Paremcibacter congregatus]QDE27639.1 sigma-70 family RNA polymerase sigma factor [Paremcibacter congregatus]
MSEIKAKTGIRDISVSEPNKQGADTILDSLYRSHFPSLCANIRKSFGSGPPEPEDVVQAAFTKYANIAKPSKIKDPRAFLYITARNIVLDFKRRTKLSDSYIQEQIATDHELDLEKITPERVVIARERFEILVKVMKSLPRKQQIILTMSRLEGKTYREICQETGWSPADISRQMSEGMITLVKGLKNTKAENQIETKK